MLVVVVVVLNIQDQLELAVQVVVVLADLQQQLLQEQTILVVAEEAADKIPAASVVHMVLAALAS